jgi:flagellar biosynthesis regulator FlbT
MLANRGQKKGTKSNAIKRYRLKKLIFVKTASERIRKDNIKYLLFKVKELLNRAKKKARVRTPKGKSTYLGINEMYFIVRMLNMDRAVASQINSCFRNFLAIS